MAAPQPPSDVAANSLATSAWANSVADALQQLIADLYPAGALGMTWANITGKPAQFAPAAHAHADAATGGLVPYANLTGKPATMDPTAHAHADAASGGTVPYANLTGKPADVTSLGGWNRSASSTGVRIYVHPSAPANMVEGDVWIKG